MKNVDYATVAVAPVKEMLHEISEAQLQLPTPCTKFTVVDLVKHLSGSAPSLAGAGRKRPADSERSTTDAGGRSQDTLADQLVDVAAAWSDPAAWEGTTRLAGTPELPATLIGGMVASEIVVHGWDLAVATGRSVQWDPDLLDYVLAEIVAMGGQGQAMGLFAGPVPVPESSDALGKILGLTGRDPAWPTGRS